MEELKMKITFEVTDEQYAAIDAKVEK